MCFAVCCCRGGLCSSKVEQRVEIDGRLDEKRERCCSVVEKCVGVCCSVLQCVAMCCSVLQCGAVWCRVVQCDGRLDEKRER